MYRCSKQHSEPTSDKRGARVDELHLTPLELIDRIAALVPPPRTHRHRYFGVLAPNSPLRAAVTALAQAAAMPLVKAQAEPAITGEGALGRVPQGKAVLLTPEPAPPKRSAHYLWAMLIARIYEVFPLLCPNCGGQMRLIASQSRMAPISGTYWSTSGWTQNRLTSHRHAGHRCGMAVMRRRMTGCKLSRTGIWQRNLRQTTRSTDKSIGEWAKRRLASTASPRGGAAPGSRCTPQITLLNTTPGGAFGTPGG